MKGECSLMLFQLVAAQNPAAGNAAEGTFKIKAMHGPLLPLSCLLLGAGLFESRLCKSFICICY